MDDGRSSPLDTRRRDMHRSRLERSASKRWRGSVRRLASAAIYNLSCFTHGCSTGWVSGVLGGEALAGGAWLAALPCLVALPAAPFFAVLADAKGRKAGAFCISVTFIVSCSLATWCGSRGVWAARVAAGAGGAGALALAPLYCAEIAPRTRGLAAIPALASSLGILFAYMAGPVLSAHALSLSMAVPPSVLLVSLLWLPETPSFLISVGRMQDAARVMCWFNGSDFRDDLTDVIEQQEVKIRTNDCYGSPRRKDGLLREDSDAFQPMLKRISGLESNSDKKSEPSFSGCSELFRHRRSRRALALCFILLLVAAGSGAGAMSSFTTGVLKYSSYTADIPILNRTVYNFTVYNGTVARALSESSETGSLLCGTALVLGAAVATVTVDRIGRKMLLIWSCSGIACCLALLGAYCDPHLRVYTTWYSPRLWPYKNKINNMGSPQKLQESTMKMSLDRQEDMSNWNLNLTEHDNNTNSFGSTLLKVDSDKASNPNYRARVSGNMTKGQNMEKQYIWPPILLLSLVLFLYNVGLGSIPFVLVSEIFPINARSLASSLLISWMWISSFILLRYFSTLTALIGLHGTYYVCAFITLFGTVYIVIVIPETKGKSQQEIGEALDRPLLTCFGKPPKNRHRP